MHTDELGILERQRGQRAALMTNLFAGAIAFTITGPVMQLYARDVVGMRAGLIGLLVGCLPFVGLLKPLLFNAVQYIGLRRWLLVADVARLAVLLTLALVPAEWIGAWGYLALIILFTVFLQLGKGMVWQPLMRGITTVDDRGRFFARMRFSFSVITTILTAILAAVIGDSVSEATYKAVLLCLALGLVNHTFWGQHIPSVEAIHSTHHKTRRSWWSIAKTTPLLRVPLLFSLVLLVMGMPLVPLYLRQTLALNADRVGAFLLVTSIGATVSYLLWGRVADALGYRPMLTGLISLHVIATPLLLIIGPEANGPLTSEASLLAFGSLMIWGLVQGAIAAGIGLATTTLQHHFVNRRDAVVVLALFGIIVTIATGVISTAWGALIDIFGTAQASNGCLILHPITVTMAVSGAIAGILALVLLRYLPNTRPETGVGDFFQSLTINPVGSLLRAGRANSADETKRTGLANYLEQNPNPMLVDPVIHLLDDPSYDVRVNAIRALGNAKVGTAGAALLQHLEDDQHRQVYGHLAWTLGEMQYEPATNRLLELAAHDKAPRVRAAAIRALGKLDCQAARAIAKELLSDVSNGVVVSSACRALIRLGDTNDLPAILAAMPLLEERIERREIFDAISPWFDCDFEWLRAPGSTGSPGHALRDWWQEQPPDLYKLESCMIPDLNITQIQICWRDHSPDMPTCRHLDEVIANLSRWTLVASLAVAILYEHHRIDGDKPKTSDDF